MDRSDLTSHSSYSLMTLVTFRKTRRTQGGGDCSVAIIRSVSRRCRVSAYLGAGGDPQTRRSRRTNPYPSRHHRHGDADR